MAIRMKEWGMLAAPGQPVHVRTQGLFGWERVGRSVGEGIADVLQGGGELAALGQVSSAGELAEFSAQLRSIRDELSEELREQDVQDWDYAWNAAAAPRFREAVEGLSAHSRASGAELARMYSAQASIEVRRDRDMQRVATARGRWEQRVESAISSGQEEQAARWLETGRGVFVPEEQLPRRREEVRSRASRSRWEARLQSSPLETLSEWRAAQEGEKGVSPLPSRKEEQRLLKERCERVRRELRRELAGQFSQRLHAGEGIDASTLQLAARAGVMELPPQGAGSDKEPSRSTRARWRRWVDCRADGEEGEVEARLSIATAPLPLAERRVLLTRLERSLAVPAADRRALCNQLFALYHAGGMGCPGDAEAEHALLRLLDEGAELLAEQGAEAAAEWVKARRAGAVRWVCFDGEEEEEQQQKKK